MFRNSYVSECALTRGCAILGQASQNAAQAFRPCSCLTSQDLKELYVRELHAVALKQGNAGQAPHVEALMRLGEKRER